MKNNNRFNIIECSGSPYDIGKQWGEASRERLRQSFEVNIGAITKGYGVTPADAAVVARKFVPGVSAFDPGYLKLVEGLAEGSALSFDAMLTLRCTLELASYYNQLSGLCTSFAARGDATADGKTILGQNIDWLPTFPMDLLKIWHKNGPMVLSLSLGGIVEYSLNSEGFGICANSLFTAPDGLKLGIPISCYLFTAMRQSTVQKAFGVLNDAARGMAYFHLADAGGFMAGIESNFDSFKVIEPAKNLLFHTNCYQSKQYLSSDKASAMLPDSFTRRERMQKLLNDAHGIINTAMMMEILADHEGHPQSICRHVDEALPPAVPQIHTLASFIMIPEDAAMHIAHGQPCETNYVKYSL